MRGGLSMEVLVKRLYKKPTYTIGKMYVGGVYLCDTLEDTDRGLDCLQSVEEIRMRKVPCNTAIPTGVYCLAWRDISPRFKSTSWAKAFGGRVPLISGVKGFSGVRIHPGNTPADTEGCILVGWNRAKGKVLDSQKAWRLLMEKLHKANEACDIRIE